jgi:uncharacterized membrane protein (DUF485 family)
VGFCCIITFIGQVQAEQHATPDAVVLAAQQLFGRDAPEGSSATAGTNSLERATARQSASKWCQTVSSCQVIAWCLSGCLLLVVVGGLGLVGFSGTMLGIILILFGLCLGGVGGIPCGVIILVLGGIYIDFSGSVDSVGYRIISFMSATVLILGILCCLLICSACCEERRC